MNKDNFYNYFFENNILSFKSCIKDFNNELYDEFDLKAKKIDLKSKIDDLLNGKQVNISENQAAWHPKYRNEYQPKKDDIKYQELFDSSKNIVTLGIGGSFEGPKLLIESLEVTKAKHIFITGSDKREFDTKLNGLEPNETLFIVSSKSFTTEETMSSLKSAITWSGDINRFIAITANRSEAAKYNINKVIKFDKEIGGRYSIWSDISLAAHWENKSELKEKFILGGKQADKDLKNDQNYLKFIKNLAFSDIWLNNYKNKHSRVVLSYIWKYRSFSDYVQQLEMESLGKIPLKDSEFKKTGQIIFGGYGPTGQHSYFQLLHQGTQDICADIIVCCDDKNSLNYAQALTQSELLSKGADKQLREEEMINGNVPVNLFLLNNSDGYSLGYLIASWEHRTYVTASLLGINPFDQFGVNAGKIYTYKYLTGKD